MGTSVQNQLSQSAVSRYLSVRAAVVDDLPEVAALLMQGFPPPHPLLHWMSPVLKLGIHQDLRGRLALKQHVCLIGIEKTIGVAGNEHSTIVGVVEVAVRSDSYWQPSKYAYLSNLAVLPSYRRRGVAQRLLLASERAVYDWGLRELYLHVLDTNQPARQLYAQAGYGIRSADPRWLTSLTGHSRKLFLCKSLQTLSNCGQSCSAKDSR